MCGFLHLKFMHSQVLNILGLVCLFLAWHVKIVAYLVSWLRFNFSTYSCQAFLYLSQLQRMTFCHARDIDAPFLAKKQKKSHWRQTQNRPIKFQLIYVTFQTDRSSFSHRLRTHTHSQWSTHNARSDAQMIFSHIYFYHTPTAWNWCDCTRDLMLSHDDETSAKPFDGQHTTARHAMDWLGSQALFFFLLEFDSVKLRVWLLVILICIIKDTEKKVYILWISFFLSISTTIKWFNCLLPEKIWKKK